MYCIPYGERSASSLEFKGEDFMEALKANQLDETIETTYQDSQVNQESPEHAQTEAITLQSFLAEFGDDLKNQ